MTKTFPLLPDCTCPELAGYKLPELPRSQEDDVKAMAKEEFNNIDNPIRSGIDNHSYKTGFTEGYRKAREKFEFSESHVRQAIEMARERKHPDCDFVYEYESEIIQSLRTPRHPIAIEVEMWPAIPGKSDNEIPKTNPDGTVKGIYIYE